MGSTIGLSSAEQEKRWRAESDMDTLIRAQEIRADPKRLKAAQDIARERVQQAAEVTATEPKKT
jgi:hypothetical protein